MRTYGRRLLVLPLLDAGFDWHRANGPLHQRWCDSADFQAGALTRQVNIEAERGQDCQIRKAEPRGG
jgi:hypothetical protein